MVNYEHSTSHGSIRVHQDGRIAILSESDESEMDLATAPTFEQELEAIDLLVRVKKRPKNTATALNLYRYRVMGTWSVLAVCFFSVCAGPLGPETIIMGDPVTGSLGLVLFPLLCSAPFACIVAELSSAVPEDGGYIVWVLNAFGPFVAFQEGYWAWLSSVFARVLRIGLAYDLVTTAFDVTFSRGVAYVIKAGMGIVLTVPSLLGARTLSITLLAFLGICVLLPFTILTAWGYSQAGIGDDGEDIVTMSDESIDWIGLANTLYWSFNGFYSTSVFGGKVLNPARTFPHAIYFTYLLVFVLYLLPLLASYSATREHWLSMPDVSFPALAQRIGGSFLHGLVVFSLAAGMVGMGMAQVFCEGYQVSGMADAGLLPPALKKRNEKFGSPHVSILFSLVAVLIVTAFDMSDLLQITNTFSALVQLLIIAAAVELRRSLPYMPRPAKLPGGIPLMIALSTFPVIVLGYIIVKTFTQPFTAAVCGGLLFVGSLFAVRKICFGKKMSSYY